MGPRVGLDAVQTKNPLVLGETRNSNVVNIMRELSVVKNHRPNIWNF